MAARLSLGQPPIDEKRFRPWLIQALRTIEEASQDDIIEIVKDFTISGHTPTRTLDASTATATDVADVLCTLIEDLQKRGMKRDQ